MSSAGSLDTLTGFEVAIIGMAGRFPGANDIAEFWEMLRDGKEAITEFSDQELESEGVDPELFNAPGYIKAGRIIEDHDRFDATFFGLTPREAALMDPQQRIFLESAWHALESAGYDPERFAGAIGVYAGIGMNTYFLNNLLGNPDLLGSATSLPAVIGNDKDYVATRVAYKLNLRGPAFTVATACSTSLVATHLAVQGVLNGECDIALAGGVLVMVPHKAGYTYVEGGIYSPDGRCRAFDAEAQGTAGGNGGVGIIALKRLNDAIKDNDRILAVVKASAINNDGADKIGYTAPSVNGQARAISEALELGGVHPDTVGYVETHGTGTKLGDPIEIAALTQAFRAKTDRNQFCALGSVKTNVGHLDAAAGVTGVIKSVLALQHKEIPPSLNFSSPNPEIDFANSPFFVNNRLQRWERNGHPRRAGVSSFGVGGTNVHVVLEEAPAQISTKSSRKHHLLVLSAKTKAALDRVSQNLSSHLEKHPDLSLADTAFTLQVGRQRLDYRRAVVCGSNDDAIAALKRGDAKRIFTQRSKENKGSLAFMFTGQGAQYPHMGRDLYESEPHYRKTFDRCCELLSAHLDFDLRTVIFPETGTEEQASEKLKQTHITQPALFVVEYALAQLWLSWGVRPSAMIGHSIGEYAAACLAGVMSLEDALALVARRGQLMYSLPSGSMLAVPLPAGEVKNMIAGDLSVAVINEPSSCVISGPAADIEAFEREYGEKIVGCRRLQTSHAFHSAMMDDILPPFITEVEKIKLQAPKIPYISNVTGDWITAEQATDPSYYAHHLRQAVQFAGGVGVLLQEQNRILLEVGPGRTLSTFAERQRNKKSSQMIVNSIRHHNEKANDLTFLMQGLGKLWLAGAEIDWSEFYQGEKRQRIELPNYPFERQRHWIEPKRGAGNDGGLRSLRKRHDLKKWFYQPSWKRSALTSTLEIEDTNGRANNGETAARSESWLLFADEHGLADALAERLRETGRMVTVVRAAGTFAKRNNEYEINPRHRADYQRLLDDLIAQNIRPANVIHLWTLTENERLRSGSSKALPSRGRGFTSLLHLAATLESKMASESVKIALITNGTQDVTGRETIQAESALALAVCKVIPQEFTTFKCKSIDVEMPATDSARAQLIGRLMTEVVDCEFAEVSVAFRSAHRWVQTFEPCALAHHDDKPSLLRDGGAYLITGGLGGIGLALAEYLAKTVHAKLVLTGRSIPTLRNRAERESWLASHDESDTASQKIRKVQSLEELGAQVVIASADVADETQMKQTIELAYREFGELNGVFHGAGCLDEDTFKTIAEIDDKTCDRQFRPKIQGVLTLEKVLQDRKIEFCMLFSSISAVLGGIGYVAYAAANSFLDSFAHAQNRLGKVPWYAINLDSWDTSVGVRNGSPAANETVAEADLVMTPDEGVEVLHRILSNPVADQIVVSTGSLAARLERWIHLGFLKDAATTQGGDLTAAQERPDLHSDYVAPRTATELKVAEIWQSVIGIDKVGAEDNFFDLGGHSLLAIQIVSRLRAAFSAEFGMQILFETPTVAELAAHIDEHVPASGDEEESKLEKLLSLVEESSDDDLQSLTRSDT